MFSSQRIFIVAACSALSGLLFGYDAGIISGALLFIKNTFTVTDVQEGWLVAMVPLGALVTSILSGEIEDLFGRKKALFLASCSYILGTLLCVSAHEVILLVIGRFIIGAAIGVGSSASPVYASELAGEAQRGWIVNLFVVFVQLGVFLSFVISYLLSHTGDWRLMIGLGVIPAVVMGFALFFLPESPRWLVVKGQTEKAKKVLQEFVSRQAAERTIKSLKDVLKNNTASFQTLWQEKRYLKVVFIGAAVSFFTQTVGINAFNYYAPTIFQKTGFASPSHATFYTMFMGLMLVISTISSLFFIDKIGRKKPLLFGTLGILATLLVITLAFAFVTNPMALGWIFFISAVVFMAFHGISIGPACFLIPAEIFPVKVRGIGMGISVAFNWGANVIVAALVPVIIQHFSVAALFGGFFIITVIAWFVFYFYIPETKGTTLEQIEKNVLNNVKCAELGSVQ